ncbi:MAG TPA: hypothetical protein VKH41_07340 [Myxococcota bacterium]|nr:hypothetical protein [Myxococcota bacterium]
MCGALLAAILLDSDAALAGDELRRSGGMDGPTAVFEPVIPSISPAEVGPVPLAAPSPPPAVVLPTGVVAAPGSAPGVPAELGSVPGIGALRDEPMPIRLNAREVLGLNDLFLDPTRTAPIPEAPLFSSSGPHIRKFGFGASDKEPDEPRPRPGHFLSSQPMRSGWLGEHIDLSFNDGISYKENFEWNGMHLRLKLWGPMLKGDPGLGMRLRGLQWSGHPVEVRARATTHLQDVQVRIDF